MGMVKSENQEAERARKIVSDLTGGDRSFMQNLGDTVKDITKDMAMNVAMPGSGMLEVSKGTILKNLGKNTSRQLKGLSQFNRLNAKLNTDLRQYGVSMPHFDTKELKGRTKAVAKEIRSAPDDFYDQLDNMHFGRFGGSSYVPEINEIVIDDSQLMPKSVRHETAHWWDNMLGNTSDNAYQFAANDASDVSDFVGAGKLVGKLDKKFPHAKRSKMDNKEAPGRKSYLDNYYGFHPDEVLAIDMEDIPLSAYKDLFDYSKDLTVKRDSARKEVQNRVSEVDRLLKLNDYLGK